MNFLLVLWHKVMKVFFSAQLGSGGHKVLVAREQLSGRLRKLTVLDRTPRNSSESEAGKSCGNLLCAGVSGRPTVAALLQ